MLYGTPAIIEEVPRFAVTWRHAGITDYIVQHGSVDPGIDAVLQLAGLLRPLRDASRSSPACSSLTGLARWGSLFFELLYLGAAAHDLPRRSRATAGVIWAVGVPLLRHELDRPGLLLAAGRSLFLFLVIVGDPRALVPGPDGGRDASRTSRPGGRAPRSWRR